MSQRPSLCEIETPANDWNKELTLNWVCNVQRADLIAFRNFLQQGLTVSVVERKVSISDSGTVL